MRKHLAILTAVWSIGLASGSGAPSLSFAQSMVPTSRQAYCARLASRAFNPVRYARCMHQERPLTPLPPAQPPSEKPPQPLAGGGQPLSPRARECNRAVADAGLVGAAAQSYLQRCVAAQ